MIEQITNQEIERAKRVLINHVVPELTHESALESALFAIASAGTIWEKVPTRFIYSLRELSYPDLPLNESRSKIATLEILSDEQVVTGAAKRSGFRFYHQNRFNTLFSTYRSQNQGWWHEIFEADAETREKYVKSGSLHKIRGMSYKTFSFWHLCLGGTRLLPIDIWLRKKLKEDFEFTEVEEKHVKHQRRYHKQIDVPQKKQEGLFFIGEFPGMPIESNQPLLFRKEQLSERNKKYQNVTVEPRPKLYLEIEKRTRGYFSRDQRFLVEKGKFAGEVDMALVASVLWWRGAGRGKQSQMNLFVPYDGNIWMHPYAKL